MIWSPPNSAPTIGADMSWPIDELVHRAQRQLDALAQLQDDLAGLRRSETSRDGLVTVTVNGQGGLDRLELAPGSERMGAERLAAAIVDTAAQAAHAALTDRAARTANFLRLWQDLTQPTPISQPIR